MAAAAHSTLNVVVRYSHQGRERAWCAEIPRGSEAACDGPAEAAALVRRFAGETLSGAAAAPNPVAMTRGEVRLRVVPSKPGAPQVDVVPVPNQSLAAFLERSCREEGGAYQCRAEFEAPSSEGFVQVRVACPGTSTCDAAARNGQAAATPMLVEQFECGAEAPVAALMEMLQKRTRLPSSKMVLLLGCCRLHDGWPMSRVAAAAQASGGPLQMHLATRGAYVFLRRDGQGHTQPAGPCSLTLKVPARVHGARERLMRFDPGQSLAEVRRSVQALTGLPLEGLQLEIVAPTLRKLEATDLATPIGQLGFEDGCRVCAKASTSEADAMDDSEYIALDTNLQGVSGQSLYEFARAKLGLQCTDRFGLCIGSTLIDRGAEDLSSAPLADGAVLSAYCLDPVRVTFQQLEIASCGSGSALADAGTAAAAAAVPAAPPADPNATFVDVECRALDTVSEVCDRVIASAHARYQEGEERRRFSAKLRGSKVFVVDRSQWLTQCAEVTSLSALTKVLGHFTPMGETTRLAAVGAAESGSHLVFVREHNLLVEVEIQIAGESHGTRRLRAPNIARLSDLATLLERSLLESPLVEGPSVEKGRCFFTLPAAACKEQASESSAPAAAAGRVPHQEGATADASAPPAPSTPPRSVVGIVGTATRAVVNRGRRSLTGATTSEASPPKRRRVSISSPAAKIQSGDVAGALCHEEFLGDLHAKHPVGPREFPTHFLCPISYDVMEEPVVVVGSGNTYDRKSIERHFQIKHTDPLSNVELRRSADRRLVPNNTLRSQVDSFQGSQVHLQLIAHLGEKEVRGGSSGDASMGSYLSFCASLLRVAANHSPSR